MQSCSKLPLAYTSTMQVAVSGSSTCHNATRSYFFRSIFFLSRALVTGRIRSHERAAGRTNSKITVINKAAVGVYTRINAVDMQNCLRNWLQPTVELLTGLMQPNITCLHPWIFNRVRGKWGLKGVLRQLNIHLYSNILA